MLPLLLSASGVDGIGVNSSCMTIELCGYIAQNQGFTYFGVEEGTREHSAEGREGNLATPGPFSSGCSTCLILELFPSPPPSCMRIIYAVCFAGEDGNLATSQGQSSSCTSTCARDPSEMCGAWVGGGLVVVNGHAYIF